MPDSRPEGLRQTAATAKDAARVRAGAAATTLLTVTQEAAYRVGDAATAATFEVLSALRGKRFFHPAGVAFAGRLDVEPGPGFGVPLLDEQRSFEAIARFSRGAGVPEPLPDILGLAVRILDAHGQGLHQDLLLVTSDRRPLGRHLLLPASSFLSRSYSSVLPYSVGAMGRFCFGADPLPVPAAAHSGRPLDTLTAAVEQGGLALRLTVAGFPAGPWQPWATLSLHRALPASDSEQLRFNVMTNTGGGIQPEGWLQHLRRNAYEASQQARTGD